MLFVPIFFRVTNVEMSISALANIDTTDIFRLPAIPTHTVASSPLRMLDESHINILETDGKTGSGLSGLFANLQCDTDVNSCCGPLYSCGNSATYDNVVPPSTKDSDQPSTEGEESESTSAGSNS